MTDSSDLEHGRKVAGMFGRIAGWYDFLNHVLSFGADYYWRYRLVRAALGGGAAQVADVAAGTLDVSVEILRQNPGARVLALDFSLPMLARGKARKLEGRRARAVLPVCADGRLLPLPDACVDAATIAFGIRNIRPREQALAEFLRILRPGGRLCVLEFGSGRRRILKGLYNFYLDRVLPLAGRLVSGDPGAYRYLAETIREFPDEGSFAAELRACGFEDVYHLPLFQGIVYIHVARKAGGEGPGATGARTGPGR